MTLLRNAPALRQGHRVETEFAAPSLPFRADINGLKQVFWNLASNALRAMPDGGCLTIGAAAEGEGTLTLWFQDTGRGMTAEEVKDFFRPFRSRFDGGTGLGTAIVYRIIEEHQGKVDVHSQPGQGTRVCLTIPRTCSHAGAAREAMHDTI